MNDRIMERVRHFLESIALRRHQLLVICEDFGGAHVKSIAAELQVPLLNVSLILSTALKDLPVQRRPHKVRSILAGAIKNTGEKTVCLDHIELCFERSLKQDPLRLFEHLSRGQTLIVSWKGTYDDQELIYAEPEHAEYVRSKVDGVVIQA